MKTYQWIEYDVWGNKRDGYEVNQSFTTSVEVSLPDGASDRQILQALKHAGILKRGIHLKSVDIRDDGSTWGDAYHTIPVYGARDGYPLGELRLKEVNDAIELEAKNA